MMVGKVVIILLHLLLATLCLYYCEGPVLFGYDVRHLNARNVDGITQVPIDTGVGFDIYIAIDIVQRRRPQVLRVCLENNHNRNEARTPPSGISVYFKTRVRIVVYVVLNCITVYQKTRVFHIGSTRNRPYP